ncbi:MAG: UbiD family decarboxylase [Chitinophagaceae bacterium]|nr:UbiD family decarboxylase [Chitinophagaceae bacterium]
MAYASLEACLLDLEKHKQLIRIKEEVDPYLEMAAIHLRVQETGGPALLFEHVKGSKFRCASNIFGTLERSEFIFRETFQQVKDIVRLKNDPMSALKHPVKNLPLGLAALKALPLKNPLSKPVLFQEIAISDIPQIIHWKKDGGAFVTLPQVYSEDIEKPGIMHANLGMYRIQLSGNAYKPDEEVGLHYQLHRGIGVHQTKAIKQGAELKVSIFVGGPPAHTVAAVMPLPEGLSEMTFAGLLGGRRFRYTYQDGFCLSTDADFVITGTVISNTVKPEGPFGDHLGYYSLTHPFPVLKVHKVYARKNAIWSFTVVGRPPQEDTRFGELIHELTGDAIPAEIPGVQEVHAVDASGVHPLLLAIGSERYTPYTTQQGPAELLTQANHILGSGQLSLAKFLWITADPSQQLRAKNIQEFFQFMLARIDLHRDLHFQTKTTIDTLDYSGEGLNSGSKLIIAAFGQPIRKLTNELPSVLTQFYARFVMHGVVALKMTAFKHYEQARLEINDLANKLSTHKDALHETPMLILCDDADFVSATLKNFLWVCFTRCNPSHDLYGVNEQFINKHWQCDVMIWDARSKPHHAPVLEKDPEVEKQIDRIFAKGGSLEGL